MKLENITSRLSEEQVKADKELITQIQIKLRGLGLYPGGEFIDGSFGPRTLGAIKSFCDAVGIPPQYDKNFAQNLLTRKQLPSVLTMVTSNPKQTFQNLYDIAKAGYKSPEDVTFLHRGIKSSKYEAEIAQYDERLETMVKKYEAQTLPSNYAPYPKRGEIPNINNKGLDFIESKEINEACVCIGNFAKGEMQTRWLGKNALDKCQFWSATKIIPILNTVCDANTEAPEVDIANCYIEKDRTQHKLTDIILYIINYGSNNVTSNAGAACLKMFKNPELLETWVQNITGNKQLEFRGWYGENPFVGQPKLVDKVSGKQVLSSRGVELKGSNLVSAYDLTRLISMLGWHCHLPSDKRLPNAKWQSLKSVVQAMGHDKARYIDVAIETLGLENVITSPVIISKLGNGNSETRKSNEITYTAFVQFVDERNRTTNNAGKFKTLAMSLRGQIPNTRRFDEIDARMAASVTEIIRRVVTDEII